MYAEKVYSQIFIQASKKFALSLHYNGDDSYLFVNGKQELKFKSKTEHFIKEMLCMGNLSDQWTASESEKTGLPGNIYDFVVDYEAIVGIGPIYDFHRYLIDLNKDEPVFYPLIIKVNKCGGDCNNINDPMAKLCVLDIVRDMNVKVFNLLSRINETKKIIWHETCKCVCRLTSAICNDRQEWNKNKCKCQYKEYLVSKLACAKGYMWNPSTCACECEKFCETGQYLDYENCVCRKKIIDDLIEQCTSIIDMEIRSKELGSTVKNNTLSSNESSNNTYFILFIVFLVLFILFLVGFIYY